MRTTCSWAFLVAAALAACADIERLDPDVCGNGVVEAGEDCDGYPAHAGANLACGGQREQACRYVCDPDAEQPACPSGWLCGDDGLCSYPLGQYRPAGSAIAFAMDDWEVHDVSGDGTPDLTGTRTDAVLVRFGAGDGTFPVEFALETPPIVGRVGYDDVDGDGAEDAVVPMANGLYLLRGAPQSLLPVASTTPSLNRYPENIYPGGPKMFTLRFDNIYFAIDEVVAVASSATETIIDIVSPVSSGPVGSNPQRIVLPEPHPIAELTRPIPRANIDNGSFRAEEFALAFAGDDSVWIYGQAPPYLGSPNHLGQRATVALSGMAIDQGAAFADVDGDGNLDLLVSVDDDRVAVAAGDGAGGFTAVAIDARFDELLEVFDPGNVLDGWYTEFRRWPLLATDLDGDLVADYVSPNGVYLTDSSSGQLQQTQWRYYLRSPWVDAVSGDFNRDGFVDLAAIASPEAEEPGIDLFLGTASGEFANHLLPTAGTPSMLEAGDFDGDFLTDIAVVTTDALGGPDTLSILYGNQQGGPSAPISMGTYHYVDSMDSGVLRQADPVPGFIDDLGLRGTTGPDGTGDPVFAMVWGAPVRRMVSLYLLRDGYGLFGDVLHQLVLGRFMPGGNGVDAMAVGTAVDPFAAPDPRLWLVPGLEGGGFDDGYQEPVDDRLGSDGCPPEGTLLAAADIDGDAVDEVVALDHSDGCLTLGSGASPVPRLVLGRATSAPGLVVGEPAAVVGSFRVPYQLELADLDDDGRVDLIATFAGEYLVASGSLAEGSGVVVFWSDGDTIDVSSASIVLVPAGVEQVVTGTPLQADEDAMLELALLTDAGLFLCQLDADRRFAEPCRRVDGVAGLRRTKGGGEHLRVADVNRDGLDDLLVGRRGQVEVFLAVRHFDDDPGAGP